MTFWPQAVRPPFSVSRILRLRGFRKKPGGDGVDANSGRGLAPKFQEKVAELQALMPSCEGRDKLDPQDNRR